jgi:Protein of unknown function (DUF2934)
MKHQQTTPLRATRAKRPPHDSPTDDTATERRDTLIRTTAYSYYEARGCVDGHDLEDWLKAEAEFEQSSTSLTPQATRRSASH